MVKAIRASALVLLLACSAQAGYIQNDAPAPSQSASAVQEPTDASQETSANGYIQNDAADSLTQFTLDALALLPSLL